MTFQGNYNQALKHIKQVELKIDEHLPYVKSEKHHEKMLVMRFENSI